MAGWSSLKEDAADIDGGKGKGCLSSHWSTEFGEASWFRPEPRQITGFGAFFAWKNIFDDKKYIIFLRYYFCERECI